MNMSNVLPISNSIPCRMHNMPNTDITGHDPKSILNSLITSSANLKTKNTNKAGIRKIAR